MSLDICINGRFLVDTPATTYAVARHLTHALGALLASEREHRREISPKVIAPPNAAPAAVTALELPVERVGPLSGNLWEQVLLPHHVRGRLLLNFAARSPLVSRHALTMVHDAQVFTAPDSYGWAFRETLKANIRVAGKRQLGLLTVSDFSKAELAGLGIAPPERIHVIYNGVDHILRHAPDDTILPRLGLTFRGYALALSNLQPHKNIGLLLRTFASPDMAGLKLVLVGGATREEFVARGMQPPENVIFAGRVSDGEMRSLQTQALAVCTPSLTEGFGLPPVEAIFLGTPGVIAPCGALPEVCGPGALHADPRDPSAWKDALLRLRDDHDLHASLARQGQAFAARFTWKAAAERLVEIIDDHGG
ncbi:glycosyltransferase family 4 protein [Ancylobacter sp.]|uniref:glycosyltransferase family 4 protein n=1 Tax=Ancylobacter sp. TaxID=1872567 RepID=UPI003D099161